MKVICSKYALLEPLKRAYNIVAKSRLSTTDNFFLLGAEERPYLYSTDLKEEL